jgi:hypothetical protein
MVSYCLLNQAGLSWHFIPSLPQLSTEIGVETGGRSLDDLNSSRICVSVSHYYSRRAGESAVEEKQS